MTPRPATADSTSIAKRRAVLVPVGEPPRVVEIPDSLEGLQQVVGRRINCFGHIPLSRAGRRSAEMWCDHDGKDVLPLSRFVLFPDYTVEIWGPILITAADDTTGETYSLTNAEAARCIAIARRWPIVEPVVEGGTQ
jgi:hypothetical protein